MLIFRQLFDPQSSTYTYLLADGESREAVLIDSVFEQAGRDAALIRELGLKLIWTLDTHVHADHVTAASLLKERLGSRIAPVRGERRRGGRQISQGPRHGRLRQALSHRALDTGAHQWLRDLCARQRVDGLHGRLPVDPGLRPDGLSSRATPASMYRSLHTQIFSFPPPACFIPPMTIAG